MKKIIQWALVLPLLTPLCGSADIMLNEGDSFVFSFTSNDFHYSYDLASPPRTALPYCFGYEGWLNGLTLTAELFQNESDIIPFYTNTFKFPYLYPEKEWPMLYSYPQDAEEPFWESSSGVIKLTSLSGTARITGVYAGNVIDNNFYIASIPEPATVILFGIGGFGAWILRRNKQHHM